MAGAVAGLRGLEEYRDRALQEHEMLILTRKIDQAIVIQGNILVRVLGIERDRVKLGIAASEDIVILREELTQGDRPENGRGASKGHSAPLRASSRRG
jgi:carbon storage regulator